MAACMFDTCCGCIELRTGCLILGYLSLVGDIMYSMMGLIALVGGSQVAANGKDEDARVLGGVIVALAIIILVAAIIRLIFTVLLLVGVHKHKRGYVKAYLIAAVVSMVLYIIYFLINVSSARQAGPIVSMVIGILLSIYFLLVIRSYYFKMAEERNQPAVYSKP